IDEVAKEDRLSTLRRQIGKARPTWFASRGCYLRVAEVVQQLRQLVGAAVYVADDVERPPVAAPVVVKRHAVDRRRFNFCGGLQHKDVPKPFPLQTPERAAKLRSLLGDYMRSKLAVFPMT